MRVVCVCARAGQVDLVKEYWNEVFVHLVADYERGVTPNPDLWCNREIKFHAFWERARAAGAVAMATGTAPPRASAHPHPGLTSRTEPSTGHYAHVGAEGDDRFLLRGTLVARDTRRCRDRADLESPLALAVGPAAGTDRTKDQSYFLAGVPRNVLAHALFPVGGLSKPQVRAIAHDAGLVTADKPKSVGICFIGQRKFAPFLGTRRPAANLERKRERERELIHGRVRANDRGLFAGNAGRLRLCHGRLRRWYGDSAGLARWDLLAVPA